MKDVSYLIIGNGIAGHSAAKEIRKKDKDGSILLVTSEKRHTYFRIKLTEYIGTGCDEEKAYVSNEDWYKKNNIDVLLDTEMTAFDPKTKKATLSNGEEVIGEKVLLAMGSSPFIPPIKGVEKEGVFAMRTMEDLEAFLAYIDDKEKLVVIGGGLLGLEAAYSILQRGKDVTVIESFDYVLGRQLNRELGLDLNDELEDMGIHVRAGQNTKEFQGDAHVEKVILEDGTEIETDGILLSTGIRPNIDCIKDSGLAIHRGIVVNTHLETGYEGVFSAGDIAEVDGNIMGLWTASMEMGRIAGTNMVEKDALEYEQPKLFTNLEIGDIRIFSCGDVTHYDEIYQFDSGDDHHRVFVENNKIVGGILDGDIKERNKIKKLVFSQSDVRELELASIPFECRRGDC
ncbi:MAG: FAD-dependent oxidoreductase [Tissierellia bacterium]|nr:FAD-dependent oxidoreductase [Tissierellia bacterium]